MGDGRYIVVSSLTVATSMGSYSVEIGSGAADFALASAAVVLVDPVVPGVVIPNGIPVVEITGNEASKTLAGAERVLAAMRGAGVRRGDLVVAVGGGVVQDVATLVSSLYMRGLPWVYVPTTLMSMADSCIGGKSSINVGAIKNLVGNIYPPQSVAIDPLFISSLPSDAVIAGLCEAVKICFCRGQESFHEYLRLAGTRFESEDEARQALLLEHVLDSKRWFIEVDEFDKRERLQLNFGHSFGHAFEAATGFSMPHGVAVGIGMLAAASHPAAEGPLLNDLKQYVLDLLAPARERLAEIYSGCDWAVFRSALSADKKNSHGKLRLILPVAGGGVNFVEQDLTAAALTQCQECVHEAFETVLG